MTVDVTGCKQQRGSRTKYNMQHAHRADMTRILSRARNGNVRFSTNFTYNEIQLSVIVLLTIFRT